MYTQLPDALDIDVPELVLGKTIQVKYLAYEGLEILNFLGAVVASVKLPRAAGDAE
jgi:hypothetical protein